MKDTADAPGATPVSTDSAVVRSARADSTLSSDSGAIAAPPATTTADAAAVTPSAAAAAPTTGRIAPVAKPDAVRGLYLNAWAAGSTVKLQKLIDIAKRTEINTFVIDVKEGGEISYRSRIKLANEIDAAQPYIGNPRLLLQKLRDAGIYPIARIVAFKDKRLVAGRPGWSVKKADGSQWKDRDGNVWVDSFNRDVWNYNIEIAKEALDMGFAEVQWDYVRFPDVPASLMATAVWPQRNGRTKADAIREFLLYSGAQLASYNVPITADVFGLTVSVKGDLGIGQQWEKMLDAADALLPMVYPSHFARGSYGIAAPNAAPYDIVKKAMDYAVKRSKGVPNAAEIRPWLQDFTLGPPKYTAAHVRAQIKATYDAGLNSWVLWNPGSNYTVAALASKDGVVPDLRIPAKTARKPTPKPAVKDTVVKMPPDTADNGNMSR
ncbi:MAG: putative glycoside hydrolase [Longimicrobiales bacterium]